MKIRIFALSWKVVGPIQAKRMFRRSLLQGHNSLIKTLHQDTSYLELDFTQSGNGTLGSFETADDIFMGYSSCCYTSTGTTMVCELRCTKGQLQHNQMSSQYPLPVSFVEQVMRYAISHRRAQLLTTPLLQIFLQEQEILRWTNIQRSPYYAEVEAVLANILCMSDYTRFGGKSCAYDRGYEGDCESSRQFN